MHPQIRKITSTDINAIKEVIDSSELFPSEFLDEMIKDYLDNKDSQEIWLTIEVQQNR